jgi:hypothetical protein
VRSDCGLLREVPRHQEPHEHREDDPADHGRKQLRARQPSQIKQRVQQRVQHAAHSRCGAQGPQAKMHVLIVALFSLRQNTFPLLHGRPLIGAYHTSQHSNKNGGPIAGTAVCDDTMR